MRKVEYSARKRNKCMYCTERKSQCYCKHEKCIYNPERKKQSGYPWEAALTKLI